jgi:hypothetical protein
VRHGRTSGATAGAPSWSSSPARSCPGHTSMAFCRYWDLGITSSESLIVLLGFAYCIHLMICSEKAASVGSLGGAIYQTEQAASDDFAHFY